MAATTYLAEVKVKGPSTPIADLTMTKFADHIATVASTPASASRRSRSDTDGRPDTETPAFSAGVDPGDEAPAEDPRAGWGASIRRLPARARAPPRRPPR